ncbi:MAG: HAMP domain-containing protein [Candidatus Omnitrophica bacterium]|nr:HAMP domain-containing protein [Candidatus Omnitrophota bacterium]
MEKRKNYFIDRGFQTRFILRFCVLVVLSSVFVIAVLYLLTGKATTVSFVNSRVVVQTTADYIFPLLIQTLVVTTLVVGLGTVITTLFISHRIAGPVYRFKKILASLGEGDFTVRCRIRPTDSLQDVAASFNAMLDKVRKGFEGVDKDLAALKREADSGNLKEVKNSISEIDRALHHFKF